MRAVSSTLRTTFHRSASHGSVQSHFYKPRNATGIHCCIMLLCSYRMRMCATGYKDCTDYEQNYTHYVTTGKIQNWISALPLVSKEDAQINSPICMYYVCVCVCVYIYIYIYIYIYAFAVYVHFMQRTHKNYDVSEPLSGGKLFYIK